MAFRQTLSKIDPEKLVHRARGVVASVGLAMMLVGCPSVVDSDLVPEIPNITGQSLSDLRGLAAQGDPVAMTTLGQRYEIGNGVDLDPDQAITWYRQAAAGGDPLGQYLLGEMYVNGAIKPPQPKRAVQLFMRAAARGNAAAHAALGRAYEKGLGVPQDYARASLFYALAAMQAYAQAAAPTKAAYDTGRIYTGDTPEAVRWYRRAARLNVADSQFSIAGNYAAGERVPRDRDEAEAWYREAAEQGHDPAAAALAELYARGANATPKVVIDEQMIADRTRTTEPVQPTMVPATAVSPVRQPVSNAQPAPAGPKFMVHLASYRSAQEADSGWGRLLTEHGDLINGYDLAINRVDVPNKGTFFRVQAQGLPDFPAAEALCAKFTTRGAYCKPLRSN